MGSTFWRLQSLAAIFSPRFRDKSVLIRSSELTRLSRDQVRNAIHMTKVTYHGVGHVMVNHDTKSRVPACCSLSISYLAWMREP